MISNGPLADADMVLKQFNANFPSSALVSELTVSEQQIIEIAKSVSLNCEAADS